METSNLLDAYLLYKIQRQCLDKPMFEILKHHVKYFFVLVLFLQRRSWYLEAFLPEATLKGEGGLRFWWSQRATTEQDALPRGMRILDE